MSGDPPVPSWRFLIKPRWLGWHALMVVSVFGMLALGNWQLHRAESGNALSWAYTFEWPIFAGFVIVFWAKTIRDEFRPPGPGDTPAASVELPAGAPGHVPGAAAADGVAADEPDDEELAAYNAYLARLTSEAKGHGRWHGFR